jgi:hypothetical protein
MEELIVHYFIMGFTYLIVIPTVILIIIDHIFG